MEVSKARFGNVKVVATADFVSQRLTATRLAIEVQMGAKRIFDSFLILAIYFGYILASAHVTRLGP